MAELVELQVGQLVRSKGCLTRLIDIVNRDPAYIERTVGFHSGRLARGYYLLLLKERLTADDIEFYGYTHFSGGRIGPPPTASDTPDTRLPVQQSLEARVGPGGVRTLQTKFAAGVQLAGPSRLVKVVARITHDRTMTGGLQYPPGAGVMQVNLRNPKLFLVAAEVYPNRRFHGGLLDIDTTTYEARREIVRYLEAA
jgi:hypothetical protein